MRSTPREGRFRRGRFCLKRLALGIGESSLFFLLPPGRLLLMRGAYRQQLAVGLEGGKLNFSRPPMNTSSKTRRGIATGCGGRREAPRLHLILDQPCN